MSVVMQSFTVCKGVWEEPTLSNLVKANLRRPGTYGLASGGYAKSRTKLCVHLFYAIDKMLSATVSFHYC